MAPAKVLHGAVRLHGLASSPTPGTSLPEHSESVFANQIDLLLVRILRTLDLCLNGYVDNDDRGHANPKVPRTSNPRICIICCIGKKNTAKVA
jgi:hypothetical protein